MGRTTAQHAGQSLRLRAVAAFLFALLFGLQLAPYVQAQAAKAPDCCMAAEGKGCSMHLHRAALTQQTGHTFAALQTQCPCTPMTPASAGAHQVLSLPSSHLHFALAAEQAMPVTPCSLRGVQPVGSGGTRGPPAMTFAA